MSRTKISLWSCSPRDAAEVVSPDALPRAPGAYALVLALPAAVGLPVPRPRGGTLPAGRYAYFGSARGPGGLAARVGRHLRADKRPRWHIDLLLEHAQVDGVLVWPDGAECAWRAAVQAKGGAWAPLPGLGSSDCRRCPAHLLALPAGLNVGDLAVGVGAAPPRA